MWRGTYVVLGRELLGRHVDLAGRGVLDGIIRLVVVWLLAVGECRSLRVVHFSNNNYNWASAAVIEIANDYYISTRGS